MNTEPDSLSPIDPQSPLTSSGELPAEAIATESPTLPMHYAVGRVDAHDTSSLDSVAAVSSTSLGSRRWLLPGLLSLVVLSTGGWLLATRLVLPILMFSRIRPTPRPVQLSSPTATTIADSADYVASLQSRQSVTLQPRVSGLVQEILVKPGDRVEAGQPMLQIDSSAQQAQLASQMAAVESSAADIEVARADVASARDVLQSIQARRLARQADVQLAQQEYDRFRELFQQGATSQQVLDQRLNALKSAQASLEQIEADIRAQQAAIGRAEANVVRNQRTLERTAATASQEQISLGFYTITAPFAGIVSDVPVKVGDYVNSATELLNITQNQDLEIQMAIPIERAPALKLGMEVQLLDSAGQVTQSGRVFFIAPNVDPATQSVMVKASFSNVKGKLRSAQFVRARIIWNTRPGVLVPTSAISRLAGRNFIFVARPYSQTDCAQQGPPPKGGVTPSPDQLVAFQQPVKLGRIIEANQEVTEGLTRQDRIITTGILQLQNCLSIAEAPEKN